MLEEQFERYISNYDLNDPDIELKYKHSYRVMQLQEKYAKLLNYSKEDIEIAKVIGLLHDFGRFEQLRVYHTYDDNVSVDHADYSVEQLFKKNEIEKYGINKEWYPIIEYAIKNHNKPELEPCTDERTLMHAKLIRDTDKIDILYLLSEMNLKSTKQPITKEVLDAVKEKRLVIKKDRKNLNDHIVTKFCFVYDINNNIIIPEIKKYYEAYYKKINNKLFKDVYNQIIEYLNERIDKK